MMLNEYMYNTRRNGLDELEKYCRLEKVNSDYIRAGLDSDRKKGNKDKGLLRILNIFMFLW